MTTEGKRTARGAFHPGRLSRGGRVVGVGEGYLGLIFMGLIFSFERRMGRIPKLLAKRTIWQEEDNIVEKCR